MEKAYEKLLKEHDLQITDLPEDAQIGIKSIKEIEKAVAMTEKKGKTVTPSTIAKLKALDKWIVREITDLVEDKDTNTDAPPVTPDVAAQVLADAKTDEPAKGADEPDIKAVDEKGVAIDKEFDEMWSNNKKECTLDELKQLANKAYDVVFDSYEAGKENGINTSNYSLIESGDKFTLTKK